MWVFTMKRKCGQNPTTTYQTKTYAAHLLWRWIALAGIGIFTLGIGFSLISYMQENNTSNLAGCIVFPFFISFCVYAFVMWSTITHVQQTTLVIERFGRQTYIPYKDIQHIKIGQCITIQTTQKRYRLWYPTLNIMGEIMLAIENRLQTLQESPKLHLPITLHNQTSGVFMILGMGLLMVCIAVMGVWALITGTFEAEHSSWFMLLLMGFFFILGLWFSYICLFAYVLRYTFTHNEIQVRHFTNTQRYAIDTIQSLTLESEDRTYRGVTQTVPLIKIVFKDDKTLQVEYGTGGYPIEYATVYARKQLAAIQAVLQKHYPHVH